MNTIQEVFNTHKNTKSDINEHLDTLYKYAKKCVTIVEFGVRQAVSSYALALARPKKLLCLDIVISENAKIFKQNCINEGIDLTLVQDSSLSYCLDQAYDMLFIDTWHTYTQLSQELEKHHTQINKYIILHDTVTYGAKDEGGLIAAPTGLRTAINEFLIKHNNWKELRTYTNCNGLTVLGNADNL